MNTKTNVKAGGTSLNHNETLRGLKVRTSVKAGRLAANHSESLSGGLKLQTHVRAGGIDTSPGRR
jgi:hypothetical protein